MKIESKKRSIKKHVRDMLKESNKIMIQKIDKALNSGALDIEAWDKDTNPMILPKIILIALLEDEASQYKGKGTCFEKEIRRESNNLKYFI